MTAIRYVFWCADQRVLVASIISPHALPVGTVLHLPKQSAPTTTMRQVALTGVYEVISAPEVAFLPRMDGFVQKVWVREIGTITYPDGEDEARWVGRWEEEPPRRDPPAEVSGPEPTRP